MSFPVVKTTNAPVATTSSVHEFICLFTHDLKRKTKRWQDGRLKYHAFNGRIMVYDDRGGNVGDSHLNSSQTLDEGEEITLDRGGAIVQVCERVGEKAVDLGDLVDKRAREVEKRRREALEKQQKQQRARPQVQPSSGVARPLSAIMNTPGRIGRAAIPKESPYEQRLMREAGQQQDGAPIPPAKRRKTSPSPPSKMTHARGLFGTQLTLSAQPVRSWGARSQVLKDRTNVRVQSSPVDGQAGDEGVEMAEVEKHGRQTKSVSRNARPSSPVEESSDIPQEEQASEASPAIRNEARPLHRTGASHLGGLRISRDGHSTAPPRQHDRGSQTDVITIESSAEEPSKSISAKKLRDKSALQSIKQSVLRQVAGEGSRPAPVRRKHSHESDEAINPKNKALSRKTSSDDDDESCETVRPKKKPTSRKTAVQDDEKPMEERRPTKKTLKQKRPVNDDEESDEGERLSKRASSHQAPYEEDEEPKEVPKSQKKTAARKKATGISHSEDSRNFLKQKRIANPRKKFIPEEPVEPAASEEAGPKTELRIKSRKRRGLLMLAERNSPVPEPKKAPEPPAEAAPPPFEEDAGDFEAWFAQGAFGDDHSEDGIEQPKVAPVEDNNVAQEAPTVPGMDDSRTLSRKSSPMQQESSHSPLEEDIVQDDQLAPIEEPPTSKHLSHRKEENTNSDDVDSDAPPKLNARAPKPPPSTIPDFDSDGSGTDDWAGPPPPTTKTKWVREKSPVKPKAAEKKKAKTGPHMKRISRSTKSKEIFGFQVPGSGRLVPDALATATGRVGWGQSAAVEVTADEKRPPPSPPSAQEIGFENNDVEEKAKDSRKETEDDAKAMVIDKEMAHDEDEASPAQENSTLKDDVQEPTKEIPSDETRMDINNETEDKEDAAATAVETRVLEEAPEEESTTETTSDAIPMVIDEEEPAGDTTPIPPMEVTVDPEEEPKGNVAPDKSPAKPSPSVDEEDGSQQEGAQDINKDSIKTGRDFTAPLSARKEPTPQPPMVNQESASTSFSSDSDKPHVKRIVNPATRGRKAASKADAAGRPPSSQVLVPYDEVQAPQRRPVGMRPPPPEPRATVRRQASAPSAMPGFTAASGGAWSRHAGDLLGMGRPQVAK